MADQSRCVELRIPFATMLKVALFILLIYAAYRLRLVILMTVIAALVAVLLDPMQRWLERHGVKRGLALALLAVLLAGTILGLLGAVIPTTVSQLGQVKQQLPSIAQKVTNRFPATKPYVDDIVRQQPAQPGSQQVKRVLSKGMLAGQYVFAALSAILFVIVLAVYLCAEGRKTIAWLISFAPECHRERLVRTAREVRPVVFSYMRGQLVTSVASFVVSLVALMVLHVPAALPLAILSFLGDFVPVIGYIASTVPAVLLGFVVSPSTGLIVLAVYVIYQAIESWVIVPRVYGRTMELSTLTVLLSVSVGGALMGPVGAILILPFVAAYPVVERIWLRGKLPEDTVEKHDAIAKGEAGERIDDVL